jgi:hypothetical protein
MHRAVSLLLVALTVLVVAWLGLKRPLHNWDEVGYVAAAYAADGLSGAALSRAAYGDIAAHSDPGSMDTLTRGNAYAQAVHRDPEALAQVLPFYTIRPAYVQAMRLLKHGAGLSYSHATRVLGAAFAAGVVLLAAGFCLHWGVPLWTVPFLAIVGRLDMLARHATPDAMACAAALLAAWLWLRGNRFGYVACALLPLVRTDFVIWSLLLLACSFARGARWPAVLAGVSTVALYLGVNHWAGHYGWLAVFNLTFIALDPYPVTMAISTDVAAYLRPYGTSLRDLAASPHLFAYFLAGFLFSRPGRWRALALSQRDLALVSASFALLHLLAFPAYMERFFGASVVLLLVLALAGLRGLPERPVTAA